MTSLHTKMTTLASSLESLSVMANSTIEALQEKKENVEAFTEKVLSIKNRQSKQTVKLLIGGKPFETFKETIMKYPSTVLGVMVQSTSYNDNPVKPIEINRKHHQFHHILDFYRYDDFDTSAINDKQILNEIFIEAQYFELEIMISKIREALSKAPLSENKEQIEEIIIKDHLMKDPNPESIENINCLGRKENLIGVSAPASSEIFIKLKRMMLISSIDLREYDFKESDRARSTGKSLRQIKGRKTRYGPPRWCYQYHASTDPNEIIHIPFNQQEKTLYISINTVKLNKDEQLSFGFNYICLIEEEPKPLMNRIEKTE